MHISSDRGVSGGGAGGEIGWTGASLGALRSHLRHPGCPSSHSRSSVAHVASCHAMNVDLMVSTAQVRVVQDEYCQGSQGRLKDRGREGYPAVLAVIGQP